MLSHSPSDKHTIATLFKFYAPPLLLHYLLATCVLHNYNFDTLPSLMAWHSPFALLVSASTLLAITSTLLKHLGDINDECPALSWWLHTHHPVCSGGLGFRDHTETVISPFLHPLVHSMRITPTGAQISDKLIHLPCIYTHCLHN